MPNYSAPTSWVWVCEYPAPKPRQLGNLEQLEFEFMLDNPEPVFTQELSTEAQWIMQRFIMEGEL